MEYHHKGSPVRKEIKKHGLAGKKSWLHFGEMHIEVFPWFPCSLHKESVINLTLNTLKQWLSRIWKHKKEMLVQHWASSHELPKRPLQSWITSYFFILHIVQTWYCVIFIFSKNWRYIFTEICLAQMKRWNELSGWRNEVWGSFMTETCPLLVEVCSKWWCSYRQVNANN